MKAHNGLACHCSEKIGSLSSRESTGLYWRNRMPNGMGLPGLGQAPPAIKYNSEPTSDWTCADWLTWHKLLVQAFENGAFASKIKYPKQKAIELANQVFAQWWEKIDSWFGSLVWCGYKSDFLSYFKSVGYTDHISALAATVTPIVTTIPKVVDSGTKAVENVAQAAENTTKVTKWLVPAAIIGVAALGGYYLYKNYTKGNRRLKVPGATV